MIKRECGDCGVCCILSEIKENDFYVEPYKPCKFLKDCKGGCLIFGKEERPKMCSIYECAWLKGFGDDNDRPDKNNIMISLNDFNGGVWFFVMETKKYAHRTTGKNIIIEIVNKYDIPVIVSDIDSVYPNDKGDYVIIKKSLEKRSKMIMGDFIYNLDDDINIYKLIIK